jgi:catechol 2,3-dioxygenase-like lactoylglutathione lyase family enzyme
MKAVFKAAWPYAKDALNLPVESVDAAIPFYEKTMGFQLVSRQDASHRSAILARDAVRIGLAENGGDPSQEGCFFEVDDIEAAHREILGEPKEKTDMRLDSYGDKSYRVFFVIAPDGLCYCLGQREA